MSPRLNTDEPLWTVRLRATHEQKERIRLAAERNNQDIGAWVLEVADAAAITSAEWRQVYFQVLVPTGNWHDMLSAVQAIESRFAVGILGLSAIVRYASTYEKEGIVISYRTASQKPTALDVAKLIAYHIGPLGVRVTAWGDT